MDDATESNVLCDAASILMRLTSRSYQDIRSDLVRVDLWSSLRPADSGGFFLPMTVALFVLGLIAAAVRNEHVQNWALILSRLLRRLGRKLKMAATSLALIASPVRNPELLHFQNAGSSWELQSASGKAACYALQGRRPKMEDRFTLIEDLAGTPLQLFAVYDGHGGEFAADFAQKWIVKYLEKRAVNYNSNKKLVHSSVQEIHSEPVASSTPKDDEDIKEKTCCDTPSSDSQTPKVNSLKNQRNSANAATTSETPKTPGFRRKLQFDLGQSSDGQDQEIKPPTVRRGSSGKDLQNRRGSTSNKKVPAPREKSLSLTEFDLGIELSNAIMDSDKALLVEAKKANDVAGSTALVAMLDPGRGHLAVANLGDSRGILCDSKGTVIPLSFDHKPQQLKERKRIQEAGGFIAFNGVWRVAGILATSRALGDFPLKERNLLIAEPDVLSFDLRDLKLKSPTFLILASDGLWDAFTNEEAARFVRWRLHEPHLGARSLALQAYKRGSVDNITVLIVNLSELT